MAIFQPVYLYSNASRLQVKCIAECFRKTHELTHAQDANPKQLTIPNFFEGTDTKDEKEVTTHQLKQHGNVPLAFHFFICSRKGSRACLYLRFPTSRRKAGSGLATKSNSFDSGECRIALKAFAADMLQLLV